jgi:peroxiredoxin
MRAWLLPLTLTLVLPSALSCAPAAAPQRPAADLSVAPAASADKLPDVAVMNLDRSPGSVEGLRAGRVALVTFWATWCDACSKEFPALNRLQDRATGDRAVVIGVAVGEPSAKVRGFVQQHGLKYAQLVDEEFHLTDALGQRKLPATLIVSRSGEVVFAGGALDEQALAAFRKALDE